MEQLRGNRTAQGHARNSYPPYVGAGIARDIRRPMSTGTGPTLQLANQQQYEEQGVGAALENKSAMGGAPDGAKPNHQKPGSPPLRPHPVTRPTAVKRHGQAIAGQQIE